MIASQQIFQTCSSTVVTEKYHEWNENPKGRPSDIKQNATGCVKNDGTKRLLTSGWVPGTGSERTSAHGTQLFGGGIVTAGGLIFIGASHDEKFRAIDKTTGEILWEYQLPCGGYATPATYEVDGKQYVVIAAGGGGRQGTKTCDEYVAFALR